MSPQVSTVTGQPLTFTNLPLEIIHQPEPKLHALPKHNPMQRYEDALNLAATCKPFNKLLTGQIYRTDIRDNQSAALLISAKRNNVAGAKRALQEGADIKSRDMTESITYYNTKIIVPKNLKPFPVKEEYRVPIDLRDQATALHWAAFNGHIEMVNFLLQNGADINQRVRVDSAEWSNSKRVAECMSYPINQFLDHYHLIFANEAVADSSWEMLDLLDGVDDTFGFMTLEHGANPLYFAIQGGHVDMADFLITKRADLTTHTGAGINALHQAVSNGDLTMVKLLLGECIDPNVTDPFGRTPLHYVDGYFHRNVDDVVKMIKILKKYGANINHWDMRGFTPLLSYLTNPPNDTVVAEFLRQGAEIYQGFYDGLEKPHSELSKEIYDAFAETDFPEPLPLPPNWNPAVFDSDTQMSLYCHFYKLVNRENTVPSDLAEFYPSEWEEYWEKRPTVCVDPPLLGGLLPKGAGNTYPYVEMESDTEEFSDNDSRYASH
ncbi:hypothetical protein FBEOM_1694 [Fusarium beomiforme]|uniref:Ankyrin n=1 Tax=Fusarium beomiforme TaxID=44412 RepID=A0A9P5ASS8_9HYPO|nr:hypothetical protein FBEOM_1694 [Fusarium beomiforme]